MGKLDDMRRLREEQHEAKQKAADEKKKNAPKVAAAPDAEPVADSARKAEPAPKSAPSPKASAKAEPKSAPAKSSAKDGDKAECPVCKKQKPLANGVLSNHQKGFGKMCPGSRQPPA